MSEQNHDPDDRGARALPAAFPIVGIGASAGGLEAFNEFLDHLAPDLGMAYVLVQHLDPKHHSILASLLAGRTHMPVSEAGDGMRVERDHVYVIPPNTNLAILGGVLHLMPPAETRAPQLTVDYFLRSLAQDQGSRAIGVILSGAASDGVTGMKMIKTEGGITFAEDQDSARYSSMPEAAIASGCVDFVLPPAEIARELARLAGRVAATPREAPAVPPADERHLDKLFILLRRRTGVDFAQYKHTTIHRRIQRRMLVHRLDRLADYVRLLQERPTEIDTLYNEILINVTAFFRDPAVFDALAREILPRIIERCAGGGDPIRIWVPGCSTGEEPYSIAMALLECLDEAGVHLPIQIFATDIDTHAINTARAGVFPDNIAADVSPARLARHFTHDEQGYLISKQIRDMCLFAKQNVVKDPPFSRLDLISCRNLLIYLGPVLQKKVLALFHYALKPAGFLLLGSAETIGKHADMYRTLDTKHKIYVKKALAATLQLDFSAPLSSSFSVAEPAAHERAAPLAGRDLSKAVDRLLMKRYCPASVVINEQMDIVQFRGQTGEFLEPAPGEASFNLLRMARGALAMELREIVGEAFRTRAGTRKEGIALRRGDETLLVEVEVSPLESAAPGFFLVVFRATPGTSLATGSASAPGAQHEERLARLEHELATTREYLQSVIEQDETINEELRSANEEILSSNEELQSTNEELETAKEELQSVNEELSTVNEELETRNRELSQLNNDLSNLLGSVNVPIVILGTDLRIRRYTPLAGKHLNLDDRDIGRTIGDIELGIRVPDLPKRITQVIDTVTVQEIEGQARDGRWYSIRVRPYKTIESRLEGAVVAFVDIDDTKRALQMAQEARDYAQGIVNAVRHPLLVLDKNLKVVSANPAFLDTFRVAPLETVGNLLYHLGNGQWGIPRLRKALEGVCTHGEGFEDFVVEHDFEAIGRRRVRISGRPIDAASGPPFLVLMQIEGGADNAGLAPDKE
ncbi:chemotaxis protein CheB [Aromatoleum anaerobium]|uniref:protein-glutamate O-methyltransferase n=1 Tax=Aromatoleum anaerobium TaxID=182180 RepID=A0ABX1PLG3_9RHOO|nr:chemotaxis protein CheB [Aromatoleum anaerobium]MCK0506504.1 PAS domain-containing protein [Aromatoleum anaerobium]